MGGWSTVFGDSSTMPVGRIDDEDDELVQDSLNAGLLAPPPEEGGGACSRPICFGALLIGLLAFGVRGSDLYGSPPWWW